MKKNYMRPELEVTWVTVEENILSNGQNLDATTYGARGVGEDVTEGFWD